MGYMPAQSRVIDGDPVSSLARGFLRLGRIGSHDAGCVCVCVWLVGGGLKHSEHMLLSAGHRLAFAVRALSSAVCLTPRARQHRTDAACRHVGSSRQGVAPTRGMHIHTKTQGEAEFFAWQGYQRKELGLQGGQLSADSAFPPLCYSLGSLLNQGLAVFLFG